VRVRLAPAVSAPIIDAVLFITGVTLIIRTVRGVVPAEIRLGHPRRRP
jgi:hypothetical protein